MRTIKQLGLALLASLMFAIALWITIAFVTITVN